MALGSTLFIYGNMKKYALIVAGGKGLRMGNEIPKQFLILKGLPVLMHTIKVFDEVGDINIILVLPALQIDYWKALCQQFTFNIKHQVVEGGDTRFHSVRNGLLLVPEGCLVAIHDGVRPMVTKTIIEESYKLALKEGSAVAAIPLKDSIREQTLMGETRTVNRSNFYLIQTPQTFQSSIIKESYEHATHENFTDDASVMEEYGKKVKLFAGSDRNIKITSPEDLLVAEILLPH